VLQHQRWVDEREVRKMPLLGTFETMSVPELLQWIGQNRKTGTLQITTDNGTAIIAFDEGELIFSASSDHGPSLSQLLMDSGLLTDELQRQLEKVRRESGVGLGKALADMNIVREADLLRLMREKVEGEIFSLLQTEEGRFQFVEDLPDLDMVPLKVDITRTLLRVSQRLDEGEDFDDSDPDEANSPAA
jgi:hypothetical protein